MRHDKVPDRDLRGWGGPVQGREELRAMPRDSALDTDHIDGTSGLVPGEPHHALKLGPCGSRYERIFMPGHGRGRRIRRRRRDLNSWFRADMLNEAVVP